MGESAGKNSASQIPREMNCADYCDALNAERWLRLLDATRRAKRFRYPSPDQGKKPGEQAGISLDRD